VEPARFYDDLAPIYHLIYADWPASVRAQGEALDSLIRTQAPRAHRVLDVTCGIGTQAIGLALKGRAVTASDISPGSIERLRVESGRFGVELALSVCDVRVAHEHHRTNFDVVLSCDNALPHLLSDEHILDALAAMRACLAPGGLMVISLRDYALETRGRNLFKPYGVRVEATRRTMVFQVWDFEGEQYDLSMFFVSEDLQTSAVRTQVMRSRYYAIDIDRFSELMAQAGLTEIQRHDGVLHQPVLTARVRPA
jgi:SAM-dependent methyltransferase